MKKTAIVCLTVALLLICVSTMAGCGILGYLFGPSESEDIANKIDTFLEHLQSKDKEGLKSLFAHNKIASLPNFDQSIEDLFAYCSGEVTDISSSSYDVEQDKDYEVVRKWYNLSRDVTFGDEVYRMAFLWCAIDTGDKGNVGIESFYIIKATDDPYYPQYSYGGDGLWTSGINIGKISLEDLS